MGNNLKLLILGYKHLGRAINHFNYFGETVQENQEYLYSNLEQLIKHFKVVSFDNIALEQLTVKRLMSDEEWNKFYMGDDGKFTFYIDLVEGKFAKNSLSQEQFNIGNLTIDEMFNKIRTL